MTGLNRSANGRGPPKFRLDTQTEQFRGKRTRTSVCVLTNVDSLHEGSRTSAFRVFLLFRLCVTDYASRFSQRSVVSNG